MFRNGMASVLETSQSETHYRISALNISRAKGKWEWPDTVHTLYGHRGCERMRQDWADYLYRAGCGIWIPIPR